MTAKLFKQSQMSFPKKVYHAIRSIYLHSKQTNVNLFGFYFYNIIQIPVFIVMVLSIRKISFENDDLTGAGMLWFKDLNEPDTTLILPLVATVLNYINLGVSIFSCRLTFDYLSEESQRKTNTGGSTDLDRFSKFYRSFICHLHTLGLLVHLSTGSAQALLYCFSRL